jgi:hypothetical protein
MTSRRPRLYALAILRGIWRAFESKTSCGDDRHPINRKKKHDFSALSAESESESSPSQRSQKVRASIFVDATTPYSDPLLFKFCIDWVQGLWSEDSISMNPLDESIRACFLDIMRKNANDDINIRTVISELPHMKSSDRHS